MSDLEAARKGLESFLIEHVPLASAAGLQVDEYDGGSLKLSAPLDKNINDKGTAFGGSLYIVCVSAGWGMTHLKSQELGLKGDLVIAKAEIDYISPLKGRLVAKAICPSQEALDKFVQQYRARGKAALSIDAVVLNEKGEDCVRYHGKYAIVGS